MSRYRPTLVDICAAVVVLFVLVMPDRDVVVSTAFRYVEADERDQVVADIARAQAQWVLDPQDGAAAEALAQLLATREARQHDQALRLAGATAQVANPSSKWRALAAISVVHGDRIEIAKAFDYGEQAIGACDKAGPSGCPEHERVRLNLYVDQLREGVEAIARGANPRNDPDGFRSEIGKIHPTAKFRVRPQ